MRLSDFFKEPREFLNEFLKLCMPNSRSERIHFILLSTLYLAFSPFFVFNTFLLDHPEIINLFFGFDNQLISQRGFANVSMHPFMAIFSAPPAYLGDLVASVFGYKGKTIFLVFFCTYLVAQSQVIIRRYLIDIIGLNSKICNAIALFFAVCAYNLVLSMTYEHFTFSFFLLCLATYYFSAKLKADKEVSLSSGLFLSLSLGGITISNISKVLSVYFFDNSSLKTTLKKQVIIFSAYAFLYGCLQVILIYFFAKDKISELYVRYEMFSESRLYPSNEFFQTVISRFFGAPILLPGYTVVDEKFPFGPWGAIVNYTEAWQYAIVIGFFGFLIWSIIVNRKNKLVIFIALNFLFDIVIHVFLKFGLGEAFIYAGHWLFLFPILIGWLIKAYDNRIGYAITSLLVIFTIVLAYNNSLRLYEFYHQFGISYYGAK